ncbi:MAG: extracellular solute-binding protein, partial [Chloroflexia bacterium]|nr:extracellular solute-binding protein [Chloroflexia bacterium]
ARPAAAQGEEVYIITETTVADTGSMEATAIYNEANAGEPQIVLEPTPPGWESKVLPQIQDGEVRWSGSGYIPYFDQFRTVRSGLAAPLEEYLAASDLPWGQEQAELYFTPRIYEGLLLDGVQYYLPMKVNVHMAGWRQDYLEAAGYETMPATWDEVDEMLPRIREAMAAEEVIPFSIARDLWRSIGTGASTFMAEPLDEQGVFKIESPEWLDMIGLFKKWIDAGDARFDTQDIAVDAWQRGKYAMSLGSHSWVRLGRQVWGPELVRGGVPPQANAEAPKRTWAHIDSACVFNLAPHAQEATDWALSIYGPEGAPAETWWNGTLQFSGSPVYQTFIDSLVTPNTEIAEIGEVLALLPDSHINTVAQANGFNTCQLLMPEFLDRYFSGELSAEEAMAELRTAINDELADQQA